MGGALALLLALGCDSGSADRDGPVEEASGGTGGEAGDHAEMPDTGQVDARSPPAELPDAGLEVSEFRLRPLVKSVLETHQLTLLAQRLHLELKVQDIELRADRAKLKLILDNLLSNALKYSPRGGTIYIHAKADDDLLVLDVGDTGPGISVDERSAIFQAFYSGRTPVAGHLKGTGIGLSVVNEFVQAHGGSVEIVDGVFPGAHFRVRVPLAPALEGTTI